MNLLSSFEIYLQILEFRKTAFFDGASFGNEHISMLRVHFQWGEFWNMYFKIVQNVSKHLSVTRFVRVSLIALMVI